MFGFKRKRRGPHPHRRELEALLACLTAWRRAVLEGRFQAGDDRGALDEQRELLATYAGAAGESDPFALLVLGRAVGALEEPLFLEALYRIETAASIAWALGLTEDIPSIEERADFDLLRKLFPLDGPLPKAVAEARLRDADEIAAEATVWTIRLASARTESEASPGDEAAGIRRSRAFERARGLLWVRGGAAYIEDVEMP